jgi:hypothetical protein
MVVLLLLSDIPVRPDMTDSNEGLTLKVVSFNLDRLPTRCFTGLR